jgi:hypothetical protein
MEYTDDMDFIHKEKRHIWQTTPYGCQNSERIKSIHEFKPKLNSLMYICLTHREKEKMMNFFREKRNGGRARSLDPSPAAPHI